MVNRKEEWQAAFGEPSPSFDARMRQTLNHLEEEKKMKKFTLRTAVIALALILAATGAVYAATCGWMIDDYFKNVYKTGWVNVPEGFESGFDQQLSQEVGDLVFTIRDAFVDDATLHTIITFERKDGKPALFLMGDLSENDAMTNLYPSGEKEDERTIAEYAAEQGLPIYRVNTWFAQENSVHSSLLQWMEEDGLFAAFVSYDAVVKKEDAAFFTWFVQVMTEEGKQVRQMDIALPVEEMKEWEVEVNQAVEGLPLQVDALHLREGKMGLHVDIAFSLMKEDATEAEMEMIQECIWFEILEPGTEKRIPGGASTAGSIGRIDDEHFIQTGDSVSADYGGDTLLIRAYDAWDKTRYGAVEVKIK